MVEDGARVDPSWDAAVSISVAARRVGLSADTLRIWERRYGLGPSRTSPGGHRRYEETDLRRLRTAVHLLRSGVPAGEAVRTVLVATSAPAGATEAVAPHAGAIQAGDAGLRLPAGVRPGVHQLAAAALDLDGPAVRRILGAELTTHGVVETWEGMLRPLLAAIGEQWERVPYTIAVEHLVSHIASAALAVRAGVPSESARGVPPRPVLLACVPHEEHELPLTALAAALRERGMPAAVLSARTPAGVTPTAAAWTSRVDLVMSALPPEATVVLLAVVADHAEPAVLRSFSDSGRLIAAGPGWHGPDLPRTVPRTDSLIGALRLVLES